MKPNYCTQNDGDCQGCSLSNYGRDCYNNPYNAHYQQDNSAVDDRQKLSPKTPPGSPRTGATGI
jgi:hypothetical protein